MSDERCPVCGYLRSEKTTCRCGRFKVQSPKIILKVLGSPAIDKKYIEGWAEQYLAWLEIEQEEGEQ